MPSDRFEVELDKIAQHVGDRIPPILRRLALGHAVAISDILDVLVDSGDMDRDALGVLTPCLLAILEDPSHPLAEDLLLLLADAPERSAQAGFDTYRPYLEHSQPKLRQAAVLALKACGRERFGDLIRSRINQESDDSVQATMLLTLWEPEHSRELGLFMDVLRSNGSLRVKAIAALLALKSNPTVFPAEAGSVLRAQSRHWEEFEEWWDRLHAIGPMPFDPHEILEAHGLLWDDGGDESGDLLNILASLSKPDLVRCILVASDVERYERALTADQMDRAETATAAALEWLEDPTSGVLEDKARTAGAQAPGLLAGAAATACGRMRDLAAKTCLDALTGLPSELRKFAFTRIRELLKR